MLQGKVEFQGEFSSFTRDDKYLHQLISDVETMKPPLEELDLTTNAQETLVSELKVEEDDENEPKETEELMAKGNVARSLYWKYFRAGGSYCMLFMLLVLFIVGQVVSSGCDYWVGYWYVR